MVVAWRRSASCRAMMSSTTEGPFQQRIVSRRAWEAYKREHPTKPKENAYSKKKEKPASWPRNVQIAGYVAAALGIPYSITWFVASNKGVREHFVEYVPDLEDRLRQHFGSPESDEVSYVDSKEGQVPHQVLADEWPYQVRAQQVEIEKLDESPAPVRITLIQDGHPIVTSSSKEVPGSIKARPDVLVELAGEQVTDKENLNVAVDFEDLSNQKEEETMLCTDETPVSFSKPASPQVLHSFWYYQPPPPQESSARMSPEEVEISRLEYEIKQLEADLKDINCTRDVDVMERELKEAKSALRKIVWKRRLRVAR